MNLKGKKVAVLGAGGSGFAVATLALSHGAVVAAFDSGDPEKLRPAVEKFSDVGVVLTCGDEALRTNESYDLAVISPGIDQSWPIAIAFDAASDELVGEIEFAYRLSAIPVIAITGTNGKTTTTSLVTDVLNHAGRRAVAAGNIGLPYSEVVQSGERYDWVVLEVSSFQLETISTFAPDIAVWMNFAPDHMDRYESVEDYRAAKLRIFENHNESSIAICKLEEELDLDHSVTFSAFSRNGDFYYDSGTILSKNSDASFDFLSCELHGKHNAENVMVALAVADFLEIERDRIEPAIRKFQPPSHRCEKVGVFDRVTYINDSKSTNLHSLESALSGQDEPVILIVGGKDKGLDYSELSETAATKVKRAICIGQVADGIAKAWQGSVECILADSVEGAVSAAATAAVPGDVVLFSPGTSSFDMFSGYGERGNAFREAVSHLASA